jgi:hypothetical protein
MATPDPHHQSHVDDERRLAELRRQWTDRYGPEVARQLEPDRRYSLVRVGSVEYAYTGYSQLLRALGEVWSAGLVPQPLPSAMGSDLLDAAPNLNGVDSELAGLQAADIERPSRFP